MAKLPGTSDEFSMKDFFNSDKNKAVLQDKGADQNPITKAQGNKIIQYLELLVRASEVNLVPLKFNTGILNLPIAVTTAPDPENASTTPTTGQYLQVPIYQTLDPKRKSPELYIWNRGPGEMFVVNVRNPDTYDIEIPLPEGNITEFYDVYELRVRTNSPNTTFVVTEYDIKSQRELRYFTGRPYVSNQTLAAGGTITELIVTDPVQGLGRNAHTGFVDNDGAGIINVFLSNDGATFTTNPIPVIPNQILDLDKEDMHTIIISSVAGASYRLAVH